MHGKIPTGTQTLKATVLKFTLTTYVTAPRKGLIIRQG